MVNDGVLSPRIGGGSFGGTRPEERDGEVPPTVFRSGEKIHAEKVSFFRSFLDKQKGIKKTIFFFKDGKDMNNGYLDTFSFLHRPKKKQKSLG